MPDEGLPNGIIVITGAAGMIGSHILCALARRGCRLVACDHVSRDERTAYFEGAVVEKWLKPEPLLEWLDHYGDEVAAIVHMGAISDTTETRVGLLSANNVTYSMDLWRRASARNWRFLYASSAATYGAGENGFLDSDDVTYLERLKPLNLYGCSKHTLDLQITNDVRAGIRAPEAWAGFKFFNVYGSHEDHKGAMRSLVRKIVPTIRRGEPVQLFRSRQAEVSDGNQARDFVYVMDAIQPVLSALRKSSLSGLFNVGTGEARTFFDLALATYAALGAEPRIEFVDMPKEIRGHYQYHTAADITKSRAAGLFEARYSLEDGIAAYVDILTGNSRGNGLGLA